MKLEKNVTTDVVHYYNGLKYEDIPEDVVHLMKQIFLDIVGLAIASHELDKGGDAMKYVRTMGGTPQATVLGSGEKFPLAVTAFANAELMHSMDYNAITPPLYVAPYVCPATLAAAEYMESTGKELLTAMIAGFECSARLGQSMGNFRSRTIKPKALGTSWNTLGGALAVGKLMKFDEVKLVDAFGLAGYLAPVSCQMKYQHTANNGFMKFGAAGWTAQAAVTAALLADSGMLGDRSVLDGEYGWWAMSGAPHCDFDFITAGFGADWKTRASNKFKSLPCDGMYQSPLWPLMELIEENDLKPEEIEYIKIKVEENATFQQYHSYDIASNVEASMSFPYCVAVVAHRIPVGPRWQKKETYTNESILNFMKTKTRFESYDYANQMRNKELDIEKRPYINTRPSVVEISARGQIFTKSAEYAKWLSAETEAFRATDDDLIKKFKNNVADYMTPEQAQRAVDALMNIENLTNVKEELVKTLVW